MKSFSEYAQDLEEFGRRIDLFVMRLFNPNYIPGNAVVNSRIRGIDYSVKENPLATSFLGRDYLLDFIEERKAKLD
jgi:hypothetical protein